MMTRTSSGGRHEEHGAGILVKEVDFVADDGLIGRAILSVDAID